MRNECKDGHVGLQCVFRLHIRRYAETHKNAQPGTRTAQYLRRISNEIANKTAFSAHMNNDAQQQDTTMIQRTHDLARKVKAERQF